MSLDVKFLYGSIPNVEGTKAIKELFEKLTSKNVATKVVTTFLALLLTLNNFFVELQTLSSNKRLCHWYNICTIVHKYFQESL